MRLILFLTGLLFTLAASSQKKLALIVAIGEYPTNSGCPPIASLNDVKYIKSALKKNHFAEKDIDTLKNNQATKARIIKALDALINKAAKNDIVVIHFACHGQQSNFMSE
jgi:metacaspase-1